MDNIDISAAPFALEQLVATVMVGSHAHGTHIDNQTIGYDDIDVMMIVMPTVDQLLGLDGFDNWVHKKDQWDITAYSLQKIVRMWFKANPNVLPLLWTPDDNIIHDTNTFKWFRSIRHAFVSNQVINAFRGYAVSQMKDMDREHEYRGYMGERRRKLVDEFGYDPKYASHAVRLLRMACEFADTGELVVKRPDADELIRIKTGQVPYADIKNECADRIRLLREWKGNPTIPEKPDKTTIDGLLVSRSIAWIKTREH